ncbi:MAG: PRC-barrel domain-containing protein [Firmicutes bacterium]|nr:PRC-barrel domain-containing protein [Bacillota bacterium]
MRHVVQDRTGGRPLDPDKTLYEVGTRDLWQSEVLSQEGESVGRVIRQVIEPEMYTVRYLVIRTLPADRHVLIPSNTVTDITEEAVCCGLSKSEIERLPNFLQEMNRAYEEELYRTLNRKPHWVEEAECNSPKS